MNFWAEGLDPWVEFDWVGASIRVGEAVLEIREQTTRCRATMADPDTGEIDGDTLTALRDGWGHQDFGVYAVATKGGVVRVGSPVERTS